MSVDIADTSRSSPPSGKAVTKSKSKDTSDAPPSVKEVKLESKSEITVQKPTPTKVSPAMEESAVSPPWLRETRLRRGKTSKEEKNQKAETSDKPSWMKEVLARRRKTQEKLNVGGEERSFCNIPRISTLLARIMAYRSRTCPYKTCPK